MIVIPMAGLSRRFREAGYALPKYMLDLHGRSLFAHAVSSFEAYFETEPFLFIARDEAGTAAFIERELAALGVLSSQTTILPGPTLGQADTVAQGLAQAAVGPETPLTIFNIDTFRPGFRYPQAAWMGRAAGYLEVMTGDDPGFSYVRPAPDSTDRRVAETVEKVVISDLASTGLYWFRRAGDFSAALDAQRGRVGEAELYVAPLYNELIAAGAEVHYEPVASAEVIFCGVPAQYHELQAGGDPVRP